MYGKYHLVKKQLSWDGVTWYDSDPLETTISGDPVATYETLEDCELGVLYRWVVVSDSFQCVGTTKMTQEKKQKSLDYGVTWVDVTPIETRAVLPVIEYKSEDCGYTPKFTLTLSDSSVIIAACDSTSAVTSGEVTSQYRDSVVSAKIGKCVTSISARAFQNCTGLTSVSISNNVISIGDYAFYTCRSLTSIDIPSGVTSIGNGAFTSCSNLTSVEIPSGVTSISIGAFTSCSNLTSVTIPSGVTRIGHSAFTYCYGLTSVGLVGSGASVEIPSGVTSLNFEIFYNCTGLTSVTIPSGVSSIGGKTFYGCRSLTSITCYSTNPPYLSSNGLDDTNNCPIYVPAASVNAYKSASGWSDYDYRIQAIPDS